MKKFIASLSLSLCTLSALAFPSYEPFADSTGSGGTAYNSGDLLSAQTNAMAEGWYPMATGSGGQAVSLASGSLNGPAGLPASKGNMVLLQNVLGPGARYNIPITNSGTLFYSVLIQCSDITSLAMAKSDIHGGGAFNMGYNNTQTTGQSMQPNGYYAPIYFGATNGGYILGIGRTTGNTNRFWETNVTSPHKVGDTVFAVAMYQFVPGGGSNDIVALWVNPDPSTFGAATYPTPTVIIDGVTNISYDADVNGGSMQSFMFGNRNATTPNLMYADELRLGYTWADVTPTTNTVSVIPTLAISTVDPNTVQLSWRGDATGFTLQGTSQLLSSGTPWAPVPGSPTTSGTNLIQTDAISGMKFYRLIK